MMRFGVLSWLDHSVLPNTINIAMNPYLERILNTPSPPAASAKTEKGVVPIADVINAARITREDDAVSAMAFEISHGGIDYILSFTEDTLNLNSQQALY